MTLRYAFPDIHDVRNTRPCRGCGKVKSVAEFPWRKGSSQYGSSCSECRLKYERERKRRITREKRKASRLWTEELTAILRECIVSGMTPEEAAKAVGRTRSAVYIHRLRQSLPRFSHQRPPRKSSRISWSAQRVATLKTLRDSGKSFTQCAAKLGTTRNAIAHGTRYLKEFVQP